MIFLISYLVMIFLLMFQIHREQEASQAKRYISTCRSNSIQLGMRLLFEKEILFKKHSLRIRLSDCLSHYDLVGRIQSIAIFIKTKLQMNDMPEIIFFNSRGKLSVQ